MDSEEQQLLLQINLDESEENKSGKTFKYITLSALLGTSVGVLLLGLSQKGWKLTETRKETKSNIQLAKENKLMYSSLSMDEKASLFEEFKDTFSSTSFSTTTDDLVRYENFLTFLELVDERNEKEESAGGTAVHGITLFADLSSDDFKSNFLGYKASSESTQSRKLNGKTAEVATYTGDETVVNWVGKYTTKIRNQGYCGSCWAFSAAEQIESDSIRAGYLTTLDSLSAEQILDCDNTDWGCDGGDPVTGYQYVTDNGGLVLESDYSYVAADGVASTCATSTIDDYKVTVKDYYLLESEEDMKNYVLATGPLSVCLSAEVWSTYTSGVLSNCGSHMSIDHCAQVVGVNTEENYWVVRNSWTKKWGEDGYIYIKQGSNTCNISFRPSYVAVKQV